MRDDLAGRDGVSCGGRHAHHHSELRAGATLPDRRRRGPFPAGAARDGARLAGGEPPPAQQVPYRAARLDGRRQAAGEERGGEELGPLHAYALSELHGDHAADDRRGAGRLATSR